MAVRVDAGAFQLAIAFAGQRIEFPHRLDLIAEERDAPGPIFQMGGKQLDHIAAHPEGPALERHVVALVLQLDERLDQLIPPDLLADRDRRGHFRIGFDRSNAVDARDGCDDDDVFPLQQGAGGGMAHPVDLFVDRAFFGDIGVAARHISFGLIIIII